MVLRVEQRIDGQLSGALDPNALRSVDHDLAHGVVTEQRLQRAQSEHIVHDRIQDRVPMVAEALLLGCQERRRFLTKPFARLVARHGGQLLLIYRLHQLSVDTLLDEVEGGRQRGRPHRR